ncbi:hypothetical protein FA10DRAFT_173819 [Acaromyces ingoldii]|uniref:Phosphoesterase-domain-containing protein n=1 Tax=Acaromyces ingoldii TaxID=215250 RepID=A0A316YIW0_9BASI|nr:hypothetical protein FA10DRAFT_173819 [Acaromyces ingoldii]PWN87645.1 hypothetical protein FA10DRAFT_173819 [Acaromyces ingoldii]
MQLLSLLSLASLPLLAAASPLDKRRITSQPFIAPGPGPDKPSPNYAGANNGTLPPSFTVPGRSFDRIIQIWMENTNFADARAQDIIRNLEPQGLLLTNYHAVGHPSEPNYMASVYGSTFGMGDDAYYWVPSNVTSLFDVMDLNLISWACYQENMPTDGFQDLSYTQKSYVDPNFTYQYYMRKHNPCTFPRANAPYVNKSKAQRNRNFNDFAADLNAGRLPQWSFVTPNMINDAHDTGINYGAEFLQYWLVPLLANKNFNTDRTLIVLTFDENEDYTKENIVYTLLLGNGVPKQLRGTNDTTFYSHYSTISTVQANWRLASLGRNDTEPIMNNVFDWVARETGFKNTPFPAGQAQPYLNGVGAACGPLQSKKWHQFNAPPNVGTIGAGGRPAHVKPTLNLLQKDDGTCINNPANPYTSQTFEEHFQELVLP